MKHEIVIKRAYDPPARSDGLRVLVDRVWPRGVSKEHLHVKMWAKDIAPSTALRTWFGHDPERWSEFRKRNEKELASRETRDAIRGILAAAEDSPTITLVYGAKDTEHNQAVVLRGIFRRLDR